MPKYSVLLTRDDDAYMVTVPTLPGITTVGVTIDDALANAREAITVHLEGMAADGEELPAEDEAPLLFSVEVELPAVEHKPA